MSVLSVNLMSAVLKGPTDVAVILPQPDLFAPNPGEFYSAGKKYPVLWLLHGGNCDCHSWISYTNLVRYLKDRGLIAVMPTGLNTDFANQPQFADGFMMTDFFFRELMPFIYGWLPASSKREDNVIAGYSMGAAAAWMLGLSRPECFSKLISLGSPPKDYTYMEPYREWKAADFREAALKNPKDFPAGYGNPQAGIHQKEVNMIAKYDTVGAFLDSDEHTAVRVREAARQKKMPEAYLLCDAGERTFGKVKAFQQQVQEWGISNIHFEYTDLGVSEYDFCDAALPRVLELCV